MAEMVDETMEGLDDEEDELDEEANEEIDKVLYEITNGKLGELTGKVGAIPVSLSGPFQLCELQAGGQDAQSSIHNFCLTGYSTNRSRGRRIRSNAAAIGRSPGSIIAA